MSPGEADSHVGAAAAYVHIPFCSRVCPYCDFAVVAGKDHLIERYFAALTRQVERSERWRVLDTIYFGGGTPSHVNPGLLGQVMDALAEAHGIAAGAEVSIEANPEDFTVGLAADLRSRGFNRVSFGAQSFDPRVLDSLGRRHGPQDIFDAVAAAGAAGFEEVSLDLIFGTPGEDAGSWAATLEQAKAAAPTHVSCYALTVEPGTPLGRSVAAGAQGPDPDVQADRYEASERSLAHAGYERYEVSNWALPGSECRYNLTVWAQGEYVAYGNGAHGHRNGVRYRNIRHLETFMSAVEEGRNPVAGEESNEGWAGEIDRLFVGLRRTVGVAAGPGTGALLASAEGRRLLESGVIDAAVGRLRVTRPLLTDTVSRLVLSLEPAEVWAQSRGPDNVWADA
jgi:oxygen-independent coproporphyrinogen-3 oxidase